MKPPSHVLWRRFFHSAILFALFPGFATGGALFAVLALGLPVGGWWVIHAQAHGHAQIYGWAGLLVLGVGYHFLPRLRGAPLALPRVAEASFWVLVVGLVARVVLQSSAALRVSPWLIPLASALEVAGISLAILVFVRTFALGPPVESRAGFAGVRPFLVVALASLWLSLAVDLLGQIATAVGAPPGLASLAHRASLMLALSGFLVPIGLAMSARLFPLYFRTQLPDLPLLRLGLGLLVAGLGARIAGQALEVTAVSGLGGVATGLGIGCSVAALGVFAPRRPPARPDLRSGRLDPTELLVATAYAWLVVAAVVLAANGARDLGLTALSSSLDAERHILGAGFITPLILGVGVRLLAGFANRPIRDPRLIWATLALGALAALCRVLPRLLGLGDADAILALAGLLGMLAVAAFWWNVPATARGR